MKFRIIAALAAFTLLIIGCSKELIVNAPWKDVSVIYGILDKTTDTNYIRIHRGYLGDEGFAGGNNEPDSLYYKEPNVKIEYYLNGALVNSFDLVKDESIELDSGFFTTEEYRTYRLDQPLQNLGEYKLVVEKSELGLNDVYATTPIVRDFGIDRPNQNQRINYTALNGLKIQWESTRNGRLYEVRTRLHYMEMSLANDKDTTVHSVDFVHSTRTSSGLTGGQAFVAVIDYDSYYRFLSSNIPVDTSVIRFYRGTDIIISSAADEFTTYMNVNAPANTVVQDRPHFTNIMGGDGANAGIFSSMNAAMNYRMELTDDSMDSLVQSMLTCDLQFADRIGQDTVYCQGGLYPIFK